MADVKDRARAAIEAARDELVELALLIHGTPELAFEEHTAVAAVAGTCANHGFLGGAGTGGLETALRSSYGSGPLNLAFCAEYDALPGIGHACGHNLIAGASVGAAIGLASVAEELDVTVTLLGTPAEERGGGKIELLDRGGFDGVHAALMAHPAATPFDVATPPLISVAQYEIAYQGKPSHASAAPHRGVNAADAMTVAQVAIGLLRQQLPTGHQVHGIITKGGEAANIIPAATAAEYFLRAPTRDQLRGLSDRVLPCFEAGALATGCSCSVAPIGQPYAEFAYDGWLSAAFQRNAEAVGRRFEPPAPVRAGGSTDMGNVSHVIPAIHPTFGLDCLPALNHQPEFTEHAATPAAFEAMVQIAVALASTAIDAATEIPTRDRLLTTGISK